MIFLYKLKYFCQKSDYFRAEIDFRDPKKNYLHYRVLYLILQFM